MKNQPAVQPTADAALLLLRLGLGVAFVLAPVALLVSRRSIFILTPIAGALVLLAGTLLSPPGRLRDVFAPFASRISLAALFLAAWAAASLLWTPFPQSAAPRLLKTVFTFLCLLPVIGALPQRTKAANLYLLPLGVALAAFGAVVLDSGPWSPVEVDAEVGETLLRAVETMLLLLWPAAAATTLRNRLTLSTTLAIVVLAAAIAVRAPAALAATACAALAFSAASVDRVRTGRWIANFGALSFCAAPVVPLLGGPFLPPDDIGPLAWIKVWSNILASDGPRMLTGHGFDYVGSGFARGYLPFFTPHSILFEIWTDLGLPGALGAAALVWSCYTVAARQSARMAPFWIGGLTYVTAIGVFGGPTQQLWWISVQALALAAFALAARGDYQTNRPTAPKRLG
jgi:hypothetical protein